MKPEQGEISIRPYRRSDAPLLHEAAIESVDRVSPWLPWCHAGYQLSESEAWIRHCESAAQAGAEFHFAIVDPTGRLLGGCGLNFLRADHGVANLGYWVRSSAQGRGVAAGAIRLLAEYAFGKTGLHRLEIIAAVENAASLRAALRAGARYEGFLRGRLRIHGRSHDAFLFSILPGEEATVESAPFPAASPAPGRDPEDVVIEELRIPPGAAEIAGLAALLVEAVGEGSAVSFLAPRGPEEAAGWWRRTMAAADTRAVFLGARDAGGLCGTVQLQPAWAPNQPHRGEVAKLMVSGRVRGRGIGEKLMARLEQVARERGFRLLTLDTKRGDPAERLYRKRGWNEAGVIPGYALDPGGSAHDAVFFWKQLRG